MSKRIISLVLSFVLIFSMCPASVFAEEGFDNFAYTKVYEGQFRDVAETAWYAESVAMAYELDLVAGTGPTAFNPEGNLKLSEVVTLAAQLHSRYYNRQIPAVSSGPWYQRYVDYAVSNGILSDSGFNFERPATRAEYVWVLTRCFPASGYAQINDIEDGEIPDVSMDEPYADAVYKFYRAGIMQGFEGGEFRPSSNIRRCEIAATLLRLADPSIRGEFSLKGEEDGDEDSDDFVSEDIMMYENTEEHIASGTISYSGGSYESEYYDDELIVVVDKSMDEDDVDAMMEPYGGVSLGYIKVAGVYQIIFEEPKTLSELNSIMSAVKKRSGVKDAYLNTISTVSSSQLSSPPNDPWGNSKDVSWDEYIPKGNNWGYNAINAGTARQMVLDHYKGREVPTVDVGVIDELFIPHEDLKFSKIYSQDRKMDITEVPSTFINEARSTSDTETFERSVHGNHVAGIIAAKQNNGKGITGIAINTNLYGAMLKNSFGSYSAATKVSIFSKQTCASILIVDHGKGSPIILNYSITENAKEGKNADYQAKHNEDDGFKLGEVLEDLYDEGYDFLIVSSAGNRDNGSLSHNAADVNAFNTIPKGSGVYDRILVVGAADKDFRFTDYYNYGKRIDVAAPGISIFSTTTSNDRVYNSWNQKYVVDGSYSDMSGTSMAAPHVAGVAALVLAANPNLNGAQLKNRIIETANIQLANPDKKDDGSDGSYHNMVNAAYAVAKTLGIPYTIESDSDSPARWSLNEDGKLTIYNGGDLADARKYSFAYEWDRWASNITSVSFVGAVTAIGPSAFEGCRNLERITIPETAARIDSKAFSNNPALKSVTVLSKSHYPDMEISDDAICDNADNLTLYGWKGSETEVFSNRYYDENEIITNAKHYGFSFELLDIQDSSEPGSAPDGYIPIYSLQDLINYSEYEDSWANPHQYILMNDIDAQGYLHTSTITSYSIRYDEFEYKGGVMMPSLLHNDREVLDGNGHTIYNLQYPLFMTNQGTIRDLNVLINTVDGSAYDYSVDGYCSGSFGGIVGFNYGIIENCAVSVNMDMLSLEGHVGGVSAFNIFGTIRNCIANWDTRITVKEGKSIQFGGICGESVSRNGDSFNTPVIDHCLCMGSLTINGNASSKNQIMGIADGSTVSNPADKWTKVSDCICYMSKIELIGLDQYWLTLGFGMGTGDVTNVKACADTNVKWIDQNGEILFDGNAVNYNCSDEDLSYGCDFYLGITAPSLLKNWDLNKVPKVEQ